VPIAVQSYDKNTGEIIYTISAEQSGEQFSLGVRPKGKVEKRFFLWKGDRNDPAEQKMANPDPVDFTKEKNREKVYEGFVKVFGSIPWVREALEALHYRLEQDLKDAVSKVREEREKDPDSMALTGHSPTIWKSSSGYSIESGGMGATHDLSNFTAHFLEDLVLFKGSGETERKFRMKATIAGVSKVFDVRAEEFDRLSWVPSKLGPLAHVEGFTYRLVAKAIKLETRHVGGVEKVHIRKHTGWVLIDDSADVAHPQWFYLHGGGAITPDADRFPGRVELTGDKITRRVFPAQPSAEALKQAIRQDLALWNLSSERVVIPLLIACYRVAMGQTDFSVHLAGKTGYGKTELARLATKHFGPSQTEEDEMTFKDTPNAAESVSNALKDQVLLIDDYQGTTQHREMLEFVMRHAGGSGRARLDFRRSEVYDSPPRSLIISTGEDLPVGESMNARILSLRVGEQDKIDFVYNEAITAAQNKACAGAYAKAMRGFIAWLAPRYEEVQASLEAKRLAFSREVSTEGLHPKVASLYGDLRIGLEAFLDYATEKGAITTEERISLEARALVAIVAAISEQANLIKEDDPVERFRNLLTEALERSEARLSTDPYSKGEGDGEFIGWKTDDGIYLKGQAALSLAKRVAKAQGEPFPPTDKFLYQRIYDARWMLSTSLESGRGFSVRKKLGSKVETVLHLRGEFLSGE
jgi:hypothetical protein